MVKLAADSSTQKVLSFTGLNWPKGVAVDAAGNLYVTDYSNNRLLKLAADFTIGTVLPYTFISPYGVAVDATGNVYVSEYSNKRVLKLAAGWASETVLPFTGFNTPRDVAEGRTSETVLPFTGLINPGDVAVDAAGNLYVSDRGDNRVMKLAAA